jgi:UDP-N-acetylmuramate dehydrogenase
MHGLEFLHGIPGCVGGAVFMNAGTKFGYIGDICESVEILDHDLSQWNISSNSLNFGYRCSGIEENTIILSATLKLKEGTSSRAMEIKMQLDRKRKTAHPAGVPSAGCFFRNPSHSMPAGRLIELAGLKGLRTGSAEISTVHANFLINRGDARAKDFISLIRIIRNKVYAQYNIKLDLEVKLVGRNIHDPF